ncbi:MAG TPA: hypothetical protein VF323_11625 [Candidatus Limnocylindrales bacterium]
MTSGPAIGHFYGDDAYLIDRAVDALAERVAKATGLETALDRWRTSGRAAAIDTTTGLGATRLAEIGARVATGTLFGGGALVIVEDPLPLVRSKDGQAALAGILGSIAPGNALAFVDMFDPDRKADRWPKDEKLVGERGALAAAVRAAGGESRPLRAPAAGTMAGWIVARARELEIRIAPRAADDLARRIGSQVGEGDVDRRYVGRLAVSALDKLALLHIDGGEVTIEDVDGLVVEAIPTSTWAMLDALGNRQPRALELLGAIVAQAPEPVVLAQLYGRVRQLLDVTDRLAAGQDPREIVRETRLNPYVADKLARMSARWTVPELRDALDGLFALDVLVKGADGGTSTEEGRRLAFTLWLADTLGTR